MLVTTVLKAIFKLTAAIAFSVIVINLLISVTAWGEASDLLEHGIAILMDQGYLTSENIAMLQSMLQEWDDGNGFVHNVELVLEPDFAVGTNGLLLMPADVRRQYGSMAALAIRFEVDRYLLPLQKVEAHQIQLGFDNGVVTHAVMQVGKKVVTLKYYPDLE